MPQKNKKTVDQEQTERHKLSCLSNMKQSDSETQNIDGLKLKTGIQKKRCTVDTCS